LGLAAHPYILFFLQMTLFYVDRQQSKRLPSSALLSNNSVIDRARYLIYINQLSCLAGTSTVVCKPLSRTFF
jgi:hypothetical protein